VSADILLVDDIMFVCVMYPGGLLL